MLDNNYTSCINLCCIYIHTHVCRLNNFKVNGTVGLINFEDKKFCGDCRGVALGMCIVSRHFEWIECTRFVLFEWYGDR